MGRRPRNNLPNGTELLKTQNTGPNLNQQMRDIKEKQKFYYDKRHAKELPRLDFGDPVRVAPPPPPEKLKHQRMEIGNSSRDPQTAEILHCWI